MRRLILVLLLPTVAASLSGCADVSKIDFPKRWKSGQSSKAAFRLSLTERMACWGEVQRGTSNEGRAAFILAMHYHYFRGDEELSNWLMKRSADAGYVAAMHNYAGTMFANG